MQTYNIISVKNKNGEDTFTVDSDGNVKVRGDVEIGALNDKMDSVALGGDFSWLFSQSDGMMMWSGAVSGTNFDSDTNMVFKIGKDASGAGYLKLRGSGAFTGTISADEGDIGGWSIDSDFISKGNAGMYSGADYGKVRFYAGSSSPNTAPFRVDENGNLYASSATLVSATIMGNISASTWTSENFSVDENGNIEANNIIVTGGIIGGCTFSEEGGVLQITNANIAEQLTVDKIDADSIVTKGRIEGLGCDFKSGSIGGWTITGFGIYSDDAGIANSSGGSYRFYAGSSNPSSADFRVDSSGNLHAGEINTSQSITSSTNTGYTTISGGTVTVVQNPSGNLNASCQLASVGLTSQINTSDYGSFICGVSSTKNVSSVGWALNGGASIIFYGDEGMFNGTWEIPSAIATTSDINKKNSITDIPDTYRAVFTNLKPKIYKYNDGKSDRYHVGFIAQDVEEAIVGAGLTTQDFAGFVRTQLPNEETGEPENVCMLRYEEFIALNTWQIQKILPRLHELESEVINLKEEILMLHQKLNSTEI